MSCSHPAPRRAGRRALLAWLLSTSLVSPAARSSAAEAGAGILSRGVTVNQIRSALLSPSRWHPFPRASERDRWMALRAQVRQAYIRQAERYLHCDWPTLKATDFLGYVRTGNRSVFQDLSYGRRHQLATLVIAECIEGRGRFRDDIVNGIWTICEETYWGVPAHVGLQRRGPGLPDVTEPTVDLFAAETGSLLAWTYYLLKDSLDTISPLVCDRIRYEVDCRINRVNLERDDFWWMGLTRTVNNWTPWICSNWLATVLILEEDSVRRARSVVKVLECLDRFLADYADDGGCDEGPSYWGRAAGSLFDCLEILLSAMQGRMDRFAHPRIREMGRYITRAHIQGPWFVNFADAPARLRSDAPTIYRYGKAIGDASMMAFGAYIAREQHLGEGMLPGQFGVLGRVLPGLFVLDELLQAGAAEPFVRDSWFPGIQVMMARSVAGSAEGLYLAAQGGHNDESHNHNDVGNFIVYLDGEPVVIDVGVETYTAKTFSRERYSIWTMQSAFHNLPTVNGAVQKEGREFRAADVRYDVTDAKASLSMEIAAAYPREAKVESWRRTVALERGKEVTVHDVYRLGAVHGGIALSLMTCRAPFLDRPGSILLPPPAGSTGKSADILYDPVRFTAHAEPIRIQDPQLQSSWGEGIWRVVLRMKQTAREGDFLVRIRGK